MGTDLGRRYYLVGLPTPSNLDESRYKIIIKKYHKKICFSFLLLEGGYIILTDVVDFFLFLSKNTLTIELRIVSLEQRFALKLYGFHK